MDQVITELCDRDMGQEGKCCSAGKPHNGYSVSSLGLTLDLKALSDAALDLQSYTTTATDIVSNTRSSSDSSRLQVNA